MIWRSYIIRAKRRIEIEALQNWIAILTNFKVLQNRMKFKTQNLSVPQNKNQREKTIEGPYTIEKGYIFQMIALQIFVFR